MSRGRTRLLYDKGVRYAMIGLAGVLFIMVLDSVRTRSLRVPKDTRNIQRVQGQVFCQERTAKDATITLRPSLSRAPDIVGQPIDVATTPLDGTFELELPYPTPPDFAGELQVAANGCFTQRQPVRSREKALLLKLPPVTTSVPPLDLRDPLPSPNFPPSASEEQIKRARELGMLTPEGFALLGSVPPTCAQCHADVASEHEQHHGKAPSAAVVALSRSAGEVGRTCVRCHAPVDAVRAPAMQTVMPLTSSFSCSACHRWVPGNDEPGNGLGATGSFLEPLGDPRPVALGTRPDTASPAMAVATSAQMSQSVQCAACHAWSERGVVLDPTVQEHQAWQAGDAARSERTCQACHMPAGDDAYLVSGHARSMWGVARPNAPRRRHGSDARAGLRAAVSWRATWEGNELTVEAVNTGAGHALPGTLPLRGWVVRVTTSLAPQDGPLLADGTAGVELRRTFTSARHKSCALPWEAERVGDDTRLMPEQPVRWRWQFPQRHLVRIDVVEGAVACGARLAETSLAAGRTLWALEAQ